MRSPFAIFRKHQRVLMVLLVGLAMLAFIFLDPVTNTGGQSLIPLLGVVLGAGVFWVIGTQTGKPSTYACVGAVLGGLFGLLFFHMSGAPGAVETNAGTLSPVQLQRLVNHRHVANQFVQLVYQEGFPFPQVPESSGAQFYQLMMQIWQQGLERALFRINPRRTVEEDVVLGYLLRRKADDLGVTIDDETVTAHIKQLAQSREKGLSTRRFQELVKQVGVSEQELYDILRHELMAQVALNLLAPSTPRTPEQYWEDYRKLNVRQTLEVAAVGVAALVPSVESPSDESLRAFFEQHQEHFPQQLGPTEPGFRQPRRLRLAFLEADYATIEKQVPEVTDEEVSKFYEDNKATLYRSSPLPDASKDGAKAEETTAGEKKAEGEKKEANAKIQDSATEKTDSGKTDRPQTKMPETKAPEAKTPETKTPETKAPEMKTPETKAPETKKSENPSGQGEAEQGESGSGDGAGDAAPEAEEKPKDSTSEQKKEKEQQKEPASSTMQPAKPTADAQEKTPAPAPEATAKPPESRPLDDELKLQIHDRLKSERTLAEVRTRIEKAVAEMRTLGYRQSAQKNDPEYLSPQQISEQLRAYAEKHNLHYDETPLLSAEELHESEEYPIGQATEPVSNPFERPNAQHVVERLFGGEHVQIFAVDQAEDFATNNRFAYWAFEESPEHVPAFDEPGIKEQVLRAWKVKEARPKAESRARELADAARQAAKEQDRPLAELLSKQTVTGAADGPPLTIAATSQFSWFSLTTPSVPELNPFQPPPGAPVQVTDLAPTVMGAGNEFMEEVFNRLRDKGEIGVAEAGDRSVYYVVRVAERERADQGEDSALKKGFMDEKIFQSRAYQHLWDLDRGATYLAWLDQFERDHKVRWNRSETSATDDSPRRARRRQ